MNERLQLIRAINENPKDDTPRLVYADWLEEYGDKHDKTQANLIRSQCAIDRFNSLPDLLKQHSPDVTKPNYDSSGLPFHCVADCSLCEHCKNLDRYSKIMMDTEFTNYARGMPFSTVNLVDLGYEIDGKWDFRGVDYLHALDRIRTLGMWYYLEDRIPYQLVPRPGPPEKYPYCWHHQGDEDDTIHSGTHTIPEILKPKSHTDRGRSMGMYYYKTRKEAIAALEDELNRILVKRAYSQ